jgi:tetratricopeptide (TPR) repeat protein
MATVPEALALAAKYHQAGRLPQAEHIYRQIADAVPNLAEAWGGLAAVCSAQGKPGEAITAYQRLLQLRPDCAEAHHDLGIMLAMVGQLPDAAARLREALRLKPNLPSACNNLGIVLGRLEQRDEARQLFQEAVRLKPDYAEAHHNLGKILHEAGADALASFQEAVRLKPDYVEAYNGLGLAYQRQGRLPEAVASFQRALHLRQRDVETHNNLGFALAEQDRLQEAEACLRAGLRLDADCVHTLNNLGIVLNRQHRPSEAVPLFRRALELQPDFPAALNNLGNALFELDVHDEEAITNLQQALRLRPDYADAYHNLGHVLVKVGRLDDAVACYAEAIRLEPNLAPAHRSRASAWLLTGDFEHGWPEFEWRWGGTDGPVRPSFAQPLWDGSALEGRTILLYAEQGLGDYLQFIRYAPLVKAQGGTVVAQCYFKLLPVVATCPGIDRLLATGSALPEFECYAPIMSLPSILKTTLATVPANVPYLFAEPSRVKRWRDELHDLGGFKIGIVWQGNPKHTNDRRRSLPLAQFAPVAAIPGVRLVSLQVGAGADQLPAVGDRFPVVDLAGSFDPTTFLDAAAALMSLDLVISVDSAIAHLAGAMAVPVWVALPYVPEFRWMLHREDSPWYPSMRLFRQSRPRDWREVFERIAAAVKEQLARSAPNLANEISG